MWNTQKFSLFFVIWLIEISMVSELYIDPLMLICPFLCFLPLLHFHRDMVKSYLLVTHHDLDWCTYKFIVKAPWIFHNPHPCQALWNSLHICILLIHFAIPFFGCGNEILITIYFSCDEFQLQICTEAINYHLFSERKTHWNGLWSIFGLPPPSGLLVLVAAAATFLLLFSKTFI